MKLYRRISFRKEGVNPVVLQEIASCCPKLAEGDGFRHTAYLEVQPHDEANGMVADQLLALFQKHGITSSRGWAPRTYFQTLKKVYDEADYDSAEFLMLLRQPEIQLENERDSQGRLLLIASKAKPSIKLGRIWANWIIVSDEIRELFETQNFKGIEFGEVALKGNPIHLSPGPFWELKSSITLPLMANTHEFIHPGKSAPEPFRGDYSKIIMIQGPPHGTGEVHYRRSDISQVLPFDVARTFEIFIETHAALIVSQRFYQFCRKIDIPLSVQPVSIDD